MNETLRQLINAARTWVQGLPPRTKMWFGLGAVATSAALTAIVLIARHDPMVVLYSDLQPEDSRAVAKRLSEQKIPFEASPDGSVISVPSSLVPGARMQLAKDGIPGQDVVGFEKFDGSTLGMSSYVQRIQYVRAVQGELTRSIQRIASVRHARVHIALPPKKTFLEEEDPPKASVVLDLRSGQAPTKAEVNGIAHLVASAVEGLKVSQVTIVDTQGKFLHRPEESGESSIPSTLLELQRSIESEYEKRVQEILVPVVGMGKVRAKVTAEIDPARVNTTEETFDPDKTAIRQNTRNEETNRGSKPNASGAAGSRANMPGSEAAPPAPAATSASEKNTQNTTYAVPRKIQVVDKPSGSIRRLTVAVVVDGTYQKSGESEQFVTRPEEELKRLQELVAHSVGFDTQRRDSITVSCLPFRPTDVMPDAEGPAGPWWKSPELWRGFRQYGVPLLGILFFFLFALRPFLKWLAATPAPEGSLTSLPRTVAELEAERAGMESKVALANVASVIDESDPLEKQEEETLKNKILEKMTAAPKKASRVVQDWVEEEMPLPAQQAA